MELFTKIVNDFQPLTIFAKGSILGIFLGSEGAPDILLTNSQKLHIAKPSNFDHL